MWDINVIDIFKKNSDFYNINNSLEVINFEILCLEVINFEILCFVSKVTINSKLRQQQQKLRRFRCSVLRRTVLRRTVLYP